MKPEHCKWTLNTSEREIYIGQENTSALGNCSSDFVNDNDKISMRNILVNVIILCMSIISLIIIGFALRILAMCKKTPPQIKYLSVNFLMSYLIFEMSLSLNTSAMLLFGEIYHMLIFNTRVLLCAVFVATIWSSACAISIDRALALTFPFDYAKHVTKQVLRIVIAIIWCLNITVPLITLLITIAMVCDHGRNISTCDIFAILRPTKLCLSALLVVYAVLIIITCKKIHHIAFPQTTNAEKFTVNRIYLSNLIKKQKTSKTTRTVLIVVLSFIIFQLPVFFHVTVLGHIPQLQTQFWRNTFQGLDYIGHYLDIYASLYIYVWKFKECRMHFYFMISRFNRKFFGKANALKIKIYNVVLKEKCTTHR